MPQSNLPVQQEWHVGIREYIYEYINKVLKGKIIYFNYGESYHYFSLLFKVRLLFLCKVYQMTCFALFRLCFIWQPTLVFRSTEYFVMCLLCQLNMPGKLLVCSCGVFFFLVRSLDALWSHVQTPSSITNREHINACVAANSVDVGRLVKKVI